jgi:hypothetical protein
MWAMADLVTCPACGAQFLGAARVCADCGVALVAGPVLEEGGDDEVGYDLADWDDAERAVLIDALAAEAIPSRWEALELVVREADTERVEQLIDDIDSGAIDEDDPDSDGGAELLSSLYVASDVLQHDAGAAMAVVELLEAADQVAELGPPYGVDGDLWRELQRRTDVLASRLGDEASDEDVMAAARDLREAVRPLV